MSDYVNDINDRIINGVIDAIDLDREISDEELLIVIDKTILKESKSLYISMVDKHQIKKEVYNSIRKLDVLQELIEDESITEIMINGSNNIYIEKGGEIFDSGKNFKSNAKLNDVIQQIVSYSNRIINESSPIVDARLLDGSRVNIVLPPISLDGPAVTIRKFPETPITMEDLISYGSVTSEVADFLEKLVISKYNIFISGGTGSGKTTFLNVLSNFIPKSERIITIEDSAELQIRNTSNIVRLEVRNANSEGKNELNIRDLIKTSLRMRPDRIIIGEVRDGAAFDLLQAFNTGHDGSLSTGHANSTLDMLSRLETLVLLAAEIPIVAIRKQISAAIDIIVQLGRLRDRSRRVLEISEVLNCENGEITINPLYVFKEHSEENGKIVGELAKTDNQLLNNDKLYRAGILRND
ncbi:MAG TPA: CpaF family protein [Clostridiales bacterium]|nr:CpaF family protein [Clostridiales bacterium]